MHVATKLTLTDHFASLSDPRMKRSRLHDLNIMDRGRDGLYRPPPAQIPACTASALGSYLGFWRQIAVQDMDVCNRYSKAPGSSENKAVNP